MKKLGVSDNLVTSYQTTPLHKREYYVASIVYLKEILRITSIYLILHQSRISVCNETQTNIEGIEALK